MGVCCTSSSGGDGNNDMNGIKTRSDRKKESKKDKLENMKGSLRFDNSPYAS